MDGCTVGVSTVSYDYAVYYTLNSNVATNVVWQSVANINGLISGIYNFKLFKSCDI